MVISNWSLVYRHVTAIWPLGLSNDARAYSRLPGLGAINTFFHPMLPQQEQVAAADNRRVRNLTLHASVAPAKRLRDQLSFRIEVLEWVARCWVPSEGGSNDGAKHNHIIAN